MYTELELKVMKVLSKPNGNGETIDFGYGDYLELFNFEMDNKTLRGVLSSLVKKDIIKLEDNEINKGEHFTIVSLTRNGSKEMEKLKK